MLCQTMSHRTIPIENESKPSYLCKYLGLTFTTRFMPEPFSIEMIYFGILEISLNEYGWSFHLHSN